MTPRLGEMSTRVNISESFLEFVKEDYTRAMGGHLQITEGTKALINAFTNFLDADSTKTLKVNCMGHNEAAILRCFVMWALLKEKGVHVIHIVKDSEEKEQNAFFADISDDLRTTKEGFALSPITSYVYGLRALAFLKLKEECGTVLKLTVSQLNSDPIPVYEAKHLSPPYSQVIVIDDRTQTGPFDMDEMVIDDLIDEQVFSKLRNRKMIKYIKFTSATICSITNYLPHQEEYREPTTCPEPSFPELNFTAAQLDAVFKAKKDEPPSSLTVGSLLELTAITNQKVTRYLFDDLGSLFEVSHVDPDNEIYWVEQKGVRTALKALVKIKAKAGCPDVFESETGLWFKALSSIVSR